MQGLKVFQHSFPTVDVADGETVTSAGTSWKVLHTPGHTPGCVCYYSAGNNLLLSGDTLFAGSIGRMYNPFLQPFNEPDADFPEEGIAIRGE